MNPARDKRGFYVASPMIGVIFFVMTSVVAAFVITEDSQNKKLAETGFSNQLVFVAQAISADTFDVLLQNKLQKALDDLKVGNTTLRETIESKVRTSITKDLSEIYTPAYKERFKVTCRPVEYIDSATYVFFTKYAGSRIINVDAMTEIKPFVSRYGVECNSTEPEGWLRMDMTSRSYFLNAKSICMQVQSACWDV